MNNRFLPRFLWLLATVVLSSSCLLEVGDGEELGDSEPDGVAVASAALFETPPAMTWQAKEIVVTHNTFSISKIIPWTVLTVTCADHGHELLPRSAWRFKNYNTLPETSTLPGKMSATLKLNFSELTVAQQTTAQQHFDESRQLTLRVRFGNSAVSETLLVNLTP